MDPHPRDGAGFRRDVAATALVLSALLALVSVALQPDLPSEHAARLAALHAAGTKTAVSATAFLLQQLPFTVAVLGLGHLLRRVAPRLSTTGVVLGVLGAFGHTVFGGLSMVYLLMADDTSRRSTYAVLYQKIETSPVMLFSLIGLAGTVFGLLVLAVALWRSGLVPRWVPGLIVAFVVLEFAGAGISRYASDLAGACALIAFAALAGHVHRMPLAAWRSTAELDQTGSPRVSARIPS